MTRFKAKEDMSVKGYPERWGVWDNQWETWASDERYTEDKAWEEAVKLNELRSGSRWG